MASILRFFFLVSFLLLPQLAFAFLERLPLVGERLPFTIELDEPNRSLSTHLEDSLRTQRGGSHEFSLLETKPQAAQFDREILRRLLQAEGYYASSVRVDLEKERLLYRIDTGPLYRIQSLEIQFPANVEAPPKEHLPIREGQALRAQDVQAGEQFVRQFVLNNYCLFETNVRYHAQIDHRAGEAFLQYKLAPSEAVVFGETKIMGLESIDEDFLRFYLTFEQGNCFRRSTIEQTRMALLQTNLLAQVDTDIAQPEDGEVEITFNVTERHHRTLRAGLGYESDLGALVTLGWQHRNLMQRGQLLDIETQLGEFRQGVTAEMSTPHFWVADQTLLLHSELMRETLEAFEVDRAELGATITRPINQSWSANVGAVVEFSRVTAEDGIEIDNSELFSGAENIAGDFALLSFPLGLEYSSTDNLLNPTEGVNLTLRTRPFIDLYDTSTRFVKTTFIGTTYLTANSWPLNPTLALRIATGTTSNVSLGDLPVSHRYYAGGGGSVRGYGFQLAGDLTDEGVPRGGLSFGETSAELRFRFGSWGMVMFIDGGYAYASEAPRFGQDFLWGAGTGIRYYTTFAPIRFDIATPLDRRVDTDGNRVDDAIQIYISIGQAF